MTSPKLGRPIQSPSEWLKDEKEQLEWVGGYLNDGGGLVIPEGSVTRDLLLVQLDKLVKTDSGRATFQKMKSGWREASFKRTHHRLSLAISLSAFSKLKRMARQTTPNEVLERLIERDFDFEETERKHRREALDKEKAQLQKTWPKTPRGSLEARKLQREIEALKQERDRKDEENRCLVDANRQLRLTTAPPASESTAGIVPTTPTMTKPDGPVEVRPPAAGSHKGTAPAQPSPSEPETASGIASNDASPEKPPAVIPTQGLVPALPSRISEEDIAARLRSLEPTARWFWPRPVMEALALYFDTVRECTPSELVRDIAKQAFINANKASLTRPIPLEIKQIVLPMASQEEVGQKALPHPPAPNLIDELFSKHDWNIKQTQQALLLIPPYDQITDFTTTSELSKLAKLCNRQSPPQDLIGELIVATCNNAFEIWQQYPKTDIRQLSVKDYLDPRQLSLQ